VTTFQPVNACLLASTFWTGCCKIIRFTNLDNLVDVTRAAQCESLTNRVLGSKHVDDFLPHFNAGICLGIANQVHPMLGSAQQDVDTVRGFEESNISLFVAADQGDNDDFSLFTLKIVDSRNSEELT
jgi:hypothetical protein